MDKLFDLEDSITLLSKMWELESTIYRLPMGQPLSDIDLVKLKQMGEELIDKSKVGEVKILLRGEEKSLLEGKLNSNDPLYDLIFYFGEKAKKFYETTFTEFSNETVAKLFDQLKPLHDFFKDEEHLKIFQDTIEKRPDLFEYYRVILHRTKKPQGSTYLSSTSSPDVARHERAKGKVVLLFWATKRNEETGKRYCNDKLRALGKKAAELGLIDFQAGKFHEEEETSVMHGILPHFIFCVFDFDKSEVVFNPKVLEINNSWLEDGFEVDQSDFEERIRMTNYNAYFQVLDNASSHEFWIA